MTIKKRGRPKGKYSQATRLVRITLMLMGQPARLGAIAELNFVSKRTAQRDLEALRLVLQKHIRFRLCSFQEDPKQPPDQSHKIWLVCRTGI